jgi:hypothetical protein
MIGSFALLGADVRLSHHLAPFRMLRANERRERCRGADHGLATFTFALRLNSSLAKCGGVPVPGEP